LDQLLAFLEQFCAAGQPSLDRLEEAAAASGETFDERTHHDLQQIMEENSPNILQKYPLILSDTCSGPNS
jgi:hypothetical protein